MSIAGFIDGNSILPVGETISLNFVTERLQYHTYILFSLSSWKRDDVMASNVEELLQRSANVEGTEKYP